MFVSGHADIKSKISVRELCIFAMLGGIMYALKRVMEFLPNIHPLALFIIAITLVFRKRALYPLYVYVMLEGVFGGFGLWWIPYLYIWTIVWAAAMLLPKDTIEKNRVFPCVLVAGLHGFLFGILYAPAQALLYGLDFKGMIAWMVAGFSFDFIHGVSNIALGFLIIPLAKAIKRANEINS